MEALGLQKVFVDPDSSSQSPDKTLPQKIQFPPVARLYTTSDKCEFDTTLSKSDVMKTRHLRL